jgi:mono/diheme cytochrome c family protein
MVHRLLRSGAALALACLAGVASAETPLERGRYLVETIAACGNCHTPKGPNGPLPGMNLAGNQVIEDNPDFRAVAPNITPDRATGIGGWTDAQLARAIREGIRPDGSVIGPPMPFEFYRGLADDDLAAIVAYLRSVPAVANRAEKSTYRMPLPPAYGPPVGSVTAPPRSNPVAYGGYLGGP